MKNLVHYLALATTLFLSACSAYNIKSDDYCLKEQIKMTYLNEAGGQIIACFDLADELVVLRLPDGDQVILPQAVSASGARYASDNLEFWEHQGKGYYIVDGKVSFEGAAYR